MSNSNNQALVSIGMPLYNEEFFLEKAIDSILSQDHQNFQIIIADNASNDRTEGICRKYATQDQRIKYYRNETNIGSAENFKKVVELAEGEYFVWVAGHDLWHPQFLSSCIATMSKDESIVLCHPQAIWMDTNGKSLGLIPGSVDTTGLDTISRFNVVLWGLGYCYPVYGLIKLDALRQTTLGLKIIGPDVLLLAELSLFGTFIHIQKPLMYIRRMEDFGNWNKYVEKVFNQKLTSMSASQLFWEIIEKHIQVILQHIEPSSPARNSIVLSIINCLLTKYDWILTTLNSNQNQQNNHLDESYKKILQLTNGTQNFASSLEQLIHGNITFNLSSTDFNIGKKTNNIPLILVDGVFFQMYRTGIARVWRSLLEVWAENGFAENIIVLDRVGTAPKVAGVRYRTIPAYDYNNTDADRQMLQQVCDEEGADIFVSTYYTTPISTPSVFMGYDMIPEVVSDNLASLQEPMWQEKHYGINHASSYITISENTKNDLIKFFPEIVTSQVQVAHCGIDKRFTIATASEISQFKNQYGITKPYFLLVGAGSNYKNAILFFQAFAKLSTKVGFEIICTGSGVTLANEYREYTYGTVVHSLILSDEELRLAYAGAITLVYPSKYEGFGMPVAEAMACGCPVITCPNSSLPEVAGEAAIYVNDSNVDELVDALCEVQKPSVRNSLITAGLAQAQKFSWQNMAEKVSQALIEATLLKLNLREINLIVFPDWSQSEEVIFATLSEVIKTVASYPEQNNITLLIDNSNIAGEEADLMLSSILMNLMMEEEIDVTETLEIVLIGELNDMQWQILIPKLKARIILESENQEQISRVKLADLMAMKIDDILSYNFDA